MRFIDGSPLRGPEKMGTPSRDHILDHIMSLAMTASRAHKSVYPDDVVPSRSGQYVWLAELNMISVIDINQKL